MELFEAIILAIVQGITEWLPVSSSGHLVLFSDIFGLKEHIAYDLFLHIATLFVVLFMFRKDILQVAKGLIQFDLKSENTKYFLFVVIGSVPIAIGGLLLKDTVENAFQSMFYTGIAFFITGTILLFTKNKKGKRDIKDLKIKDAIYIGLFQSLAIFPGVSRSGSTISGSLFNGIKRETAARISFLLFIPAIFGATILQFDKLSNLNEIMGIAVVGFLVTMAVSYFVIKFLLDIIKKGKFHYFAYYCFAVGIFTLIRYFYK